MSIRILHFSDFHLEGKHIKEAKALLHNMIVSIKKENLHPDLILFTGDMLYQGGGGFENGIGEGFDAFKKYVMDEMCIALGVEKSHFIIVPGNHDINRKADFDRLEDNLTKSTTTEEGVCELMQDSDIENYTHRMDAYKAFEKKVYEPILGDNYTYSRFASVFKLEIGKHKVGIIGLNTVWRCGKEDADKLVLGLTQITRSAPFIEDCDVKIIMGHHRYTHLRKFERKPLKELIAENCDMYFTGHEHTCDAEYVYPKYENGFFDVNTAGSLTANEFPEKEDYRNAFQWIEAYPEEELKPMILSVYDQQNGQYFEKNEKIGKPEEHGKCVRSMLPYNKLLKKREVDEQIEKEAREQSFLQEIGPFVYIQELLKNPDRFQEPFAESDKIREIIQQLRGEGNRMRFMALSGMGKTRIVLEAYREQDNVFYSPTSECEDGLLRLMTYKKDGVIVVDNCPIDKQRDIQKILDDMPNNFKLVTIHNILKASEKKVGGGLLELSYDDAAAVIDMMLKSYPIVAQKPELAERIRQRCGNIPFMAVLLIKAYQTNRNLRIENKNEVLSTLLKSCKEDTDEWRVLSSISMFDPLGKDGNLEDEYKFVITNPKVHHIKAHPQSMVDMIFEDTIDEFKERQLIEHDGSCIRIRPLPLAEWLAEDWLHKNKKDFKDVAQKIHDLDSNLSYRLIQRISKRINGLTESPDAKELVKLFNKPGEGILADEKFAFSYSWSQFFMSMGQLCPEVVGHNMYTLLRRKSISWMRNEMDSHVRRNWVWALTNIVADADAFPEAARSLLLLAMAESEEYANNATGQFIQLFHIMLSGTRASLEPRAEVIEEMYAKGIDRLLILRSIRSAYTIHGVTLDMNDGLKDENGDLMEYKPETYGHLHRYWLRCMAVLEKVANEDEAYRADIREWIPTCLRDMCEYGGWVVYDQLMEKFHREDEDWMEMYKGISIYLEHGNMTDLLREKLEAWKEKLAPKDFSNRLNKIQVEAFSDRSMSFDERWKYEAEQMRPMVKEFINRKLYEDGYTLPTMICDKAFHNYHFAQELVKELEKDDFTFEAVTYYIIEAIKKEPKEFESIFVGMFVSYIQDVDRLNRFREALFDKGYYRLTSSIDGNTDDEKHSRLAIVLDAYDKRKYDAYCVDNYLRRVRYHDVKNVLEIFHSLRNHPSEELDDPAYRFISYTIVFTSTEDIQASGKMKEVQEVLLSYPYNKNANQLAHEYVRKMEHLLEEINDSDFAYAVHRKAVETLSIEFVSNNPFEQVYFSLLPKYQKVVLPDLLEVLADEKNLYYGLSMTNHLGSGFGTGKGPLFQCDEESLKEACKRYPNRMPRLLANMCPIYEWEEDKKVSLSKFFLWLCDEFGDNVEVLHAFDANLNTFGWSGFGSMAGHYEAEIPYFEQLLTHPKYTVREWAKAEIESIKKDVIIEEDKYGYDRMTRE
jgi:hypothetical protein